MTGEVKNGIKGCVESRTTQQPALKAVFEAIKLEAIGGVHAYLSHKLPRIRRLIRKEWQRNYWHAMVRCLHLSTSSDQLSRQPLSAFLSIILNMSCTRFTSL